MDYETVAACTRCGTRLSATERFCWSCGARIGGDHATPVPRDLLLERLREVTLGDYDVHSEIGRGGMAAVYLAYDLRLQRKVAIKVMLPHLLAADGMTDRFLREARTAASLAHPNIVVIHDVSAQDDLFYIVMSLIEGAALDDVLRTSGPLPDDEIRWIVSQAARALSHAHHAGVVHRDVKPANIMITTRGDAVLTDFGIAKASDASTLTLTGLAIGTPGYMSPEQVTGGGVSGAADQYSLGVVAYQMLAGDIPFRGTAVEVQWAHVHTQPTPLRERSPKVPRALAATVMRMLRKKPEERWPSLDDVADAMAEGIPVSGGSTRSSLATRAGQRQVERPIGIPTTPQSPLPRMAESARPADAAPAPAPTPAPTPAAARTAAPKPRAFPPLAVVGVPLLLAVGWVVFRLTTRLPSGRADTTRADSVAPSGSRGARAPDTAAGMSTDSLATQRANRDTVAASIERGRKARTLPDKRAAESIPTRTDTASARTSVSPATVTPEPVVKEKISADSKPDTQARSASGADGADAAPPVTGLLPYETNVAVRKWLAQAGQNLEAALEANGNSKDLGKRLRQLDAVKFAAAGGLVLTTLTNEDPHTVRADVRFPTQNAMGVEGTMTLILRLTLSDVGVSRAIAIRAVEFKPR